MELYNLLVQHFGIVPADHTPNTQKDRQKRIINMLSDKQKRLENRNLYSLRYVATNENEKKFAIDLYEQEKQG